MEITEYFSSDDKAHCLSEISRSDWTAGKFLHELLSTGKYEDFCGEGLKVLLLTQGGELISFCTYAMKDEIPDTDLHKWVGFVYTFPKHRGKRCAGRLLEHAYSLARAEGLPFLYISTDKTGVYEKYGYSYWKTMTAFDGEKCRIYRISVL